MQRRLGKALLPQPWRERDAVAVRMQTDPLQDIDPVDVGIDPLHAAGGQQALNDPNLLGADLGPTEQPVAPTHGNHPPRALPVIGIRRHLGITQEHPQLRLSLGGVCQCLR